METNYVSDTVMNRFIESKTKTKEELLSNKYIIVINGRIFSDYRGLYMFESRDKAMKSFYNTCSWIIKRDIYQDEHPNPEYIWESGTDADRRTNWNRFKKTLQDKYNFEIVKL